LVSGDDYGVHIGNPSWSPDGAKIAFRGITPDGTGNVDVYTVRLADSTFTRVTNHPAVEDSPVWRP
jgi:Tol biopolymer transport system component